MSNHPNFNRRPRVSFSSGLTTTEYLGECARSSGLTDCSLRQRLLFEFSSLLFTHESIASKHQCRRLSGRYAKRYAEAPFQLSLTIKYTVQTRLAYSRVWHRVDVGTDARSLGRVASSIAFFLMGKQKPIWDPSTDCGDYVVAVGCTSLHTTGKKRFQKKYYSHTTRPGSLRSMSMDEMMQKWGGGEVLRRAVRGMLPKNRLRDKRMARLKGLSIPVLFHILPVVVAGETIGGAGADAFLLLLLSAAFEGYRHPYGQNIIASHGATPTSEIASLPQVKDAFQKEAETVAQN